MRARWYVRESEQGVEESGRSEEEEEEKEKEGGPGSLCVMVIFNTRGFWCQDVRS